MFLCLEKQINHICIVLVLSLPTAKEDKKINRSPGRTPLPSHSLPGPDPSLGGFQQELVLQGVVRLQGPPNPWKTEQILLFTWTLRSNLLFAPILSYLFYSWRRWVKQILGHLLSAFQLSQSPHCQCHLSQQAATVGRDKPLVTCHLQNALVEYLACITSFHSETIVCWENPSDQSQNQQCCSDRAVLDYLGPAVWAQQ